MLSSRLVLRAPLLIANLTVIAALVIGSGAHWIVLQGVAWTAMYVEYSQAASPAEALTRTFGGLDPCNICMTITEGDMQQKQQETTQPVPEIKGVLALTPHAVAPPFTRFSWASFLESGAPLRHSPPVPPPRAV